MQAEALAKVEQELAAALKLAEGAMAAEKAATTAAAKAQEDAAATVACQEQRSALICSSLYTCCCCCFVRSLLTVCNIPVPFWAVDGLLT